MNFEIKSARIEGVKIIQPFYVEDNRGYFLKSFEKDVFKSFGLKNEVYEDFESYSKKNVIRGMHFQTQNPQIKIVRAIRGTIQDVVVDIRKDSPTYGQWESFELSEDNHLALWVPAGFAHGFRVISDGALVSYKCVGKYLAGYDSGIRWDDTKLNIDWNGIEPIVSERDNQLMTFKEFTEEYGGLDV